MNTYGYVYQNPIIYTDPTGEIGPLGAGIGASVELSLQLMGNGFDIGKVDWVDVAIAGAFGAIAPGLYSSGKTIYGTGKQGYRTYKKINNARDGSRYKKRLNRKLDKAKKRIAGELGTQGLFQGGKKLAKDNFDYDEIRKKFCLLNPGASMCQPDDCQ